MSPTGRARRVVAARAVLALATAAVFVASAASAAASAASSPSPPNADASKTSQKESSLPDPTKTPPLPQSFTYLPSYAGDVSSFSSWKPMACDSGHAYCFPRCAPRGGARPRCAGGPSWRLDPTTGLCFRLQGAAADAALRAAAPKEGEKFDEMEVRMRAWTDDPLNAEEITRTPPACPPGAAPFPPLPAGAALASLAAAPDPKLCLWCQPGDTLDMSDNRPRCLKPCPAGYDAVVLGGDGEEEDEDDGSAQQQQQRRAAFCVQRCRPQDGYPYGRYCVAYGDFEYPGDCGWMTSCDDGRVLLQHGGNEDGGDEDGGASSSSSDWLSEALLGGGGSDDGGGKNKDKQEGSSSDIGGRFSPPLSHMWAAPGVNDEVVGLGNGYGGPSPSYPYGAAARAADRAMLRRGGVAAAASAAARATSGGSGSKQKPTPPSSPDLAAYLDQFDRQYVRSPQYDPAAKCRCARLAAQGSDRDARPRQQYLPLARLPEAEVQTALPRCSEATSSSAGAAAGTSGSGGECRYDRERGSCVCGCPAGWRAAGAGEEKEKEGEKMSGGASSPSSSGNGGEGAVCCDPACPEGFSACESGGRRFCATSKPLLGAEACSVLSRLVPFLSPSATCGASEPAPALGSAGAASPGGNDFSPRAVVSAVVASSAVEAGENDGVPAQAGDYPGALFGGITSLPEDAFAAGGDDEDDEATAATAASGARSSSSSAADPSNGDDGASSLLAAALERQYEVTTNTPPHPMSIQEVLAMDPWASDFKDGTAAGKKESESGGKKDEAQE